MSASVSQSAPGSNTAVTAVLHAAWAAKAAASANAASAGSKVAGAAANAASNAADAGSNAANAANASAKAAKAAEYAAAAGGAAANAASNAASGGPSAANIQNAAAHAAEAAAKAAAAGSNAGSNARGNAANAGANAAAAGDAANSASNASANGAAHAASNSAAAAAIVATGSAANGSASNASANGAAHAASNAAAAAAIVATGSAPNGAAHAASAGVNAASNAANLASRSGAASVAQSVPLPVPAAAAAQVATQSPSILAVAAGPPAPPAPLVQAAAIAPILPQTSVVAAAAGGALASVPARVGAPPIVANAASVPAAVAQIGAPPAQVAGSARSPSVAADTDDPAAPPSQTAQAAPSPESPLAASKIEVSGRGPRGGSEQQQRVAIALGAGLLEFSRGGAIVRKGEILAVAPTASTLATARGLGFTVLETLPLKALGLSAVILHAPSGVPADDALGRLQAADPEGGYSLNPIYATTGQVGPAASAAPESATPTAVRRAAAVGLIDTGVFAQHPALAGTRLEQQGFAPGGLTPAKHGTAVASIAVGQAGAFHGVAPGSRIYVADVYGKTGVGGSASAVAEGIDWLVHKGAPVINISLVGPPNRLMEAAVEAAISKGVIVVAAVGNDGPSSPPLYPAAYRGVLAVTGVDQNDHILLEAVRATQVAFAAPGADIFAADGAAGFAKVRGTSFAAPIVAGQLALAHRRLDDKDATAAVQRLKRAAKAPGDAAFGFGIVGESARGALRPGLSQITTAEAAEHSEE